MNAHNNAVRMSTFLPFQFTPEEMLRASLLGNLPRTEVLGRIFEFDGAWSFALSVHGKDYARADGYDTPEDAAFFLLGSIDIARKNGYDAKLDPACPYGFVSGFWEGGEDDAGNGAPDQKPGTVTC